MQPVVVPILRAGLGFVHAAQELLPDADVGFIGISRDEETFAPKPYVNKLPESLAGRPVIVIDPMLATGGSLVHTVELLVERDAPAADHRGLRALRARGHRPAEGGRPLAARRDGRRSTTTSTIGVHRPRPRRRRRPPVRPPPDASGLVGTSTTGMSMSVRPCPAADRATGERLGVSWGLAGGIALASIDEVREVTRYAVEAGFDSLWISHANAVDPIVALAATPPTSAGLTEVGTSVVPLYGRHPIGLAQLARTAQSALGGRFTLGIGAASKGAVGASMGLPWDRPLALHPRVHRRPAAAARRPGRRRRRRPGDDARRAQHHGARHADPAGCAGTQDARARRTPGPGHQRRAVRPAHHRHAHRTDDPRRRRSGRSADAAHHGADPPVRHRRPRRALRPRQETATRYRRCPPTSGCRTWRASTIRPSCT